ncbi:hypothetical protein BDL97_11G099400 [Sphagnum fallax]|nr:hypothetical protein BDL97_11G099400 [Sphagnum fallax]KAH8948541.1 hypothetical protein BDL97_11G099400 [Sphagnum fallax]
MSEAFPDYLRFIKRRLLEDEEAGAVLLPSRDIPHCFALSAGAALTAAGAANVICLSSSETEFELASYKPGSDEEEAEAAVSDALLLPLEPQVVDALRFSDSATPGDSPPAEFQILFPTAGMDGADRPSVLFCPDKTKADSKKRTCYTAGFKIDRDSESSAVPAADHVTCVAPCLEPVRNHGTNHHIL